MFFSRSKNVLCMVSDKIGDIAINKNPCELPRNEYQVMYARGYITYIKGIHNLHTLPCKDLLTVKCYTLTQLDDTMHPPKLSPPFRVL